MRWLRLWTDIISDPKVRMLAFEDRWHFVALLCMKRRGELDGVKGDLLERTVGVTLGVGDRDRDEIKRRLIEVTLIDESWQPKAWERRQFPSDSSTQRVRAFRERSGNVSSNDEKRSGNALEQSQSRVRTEKSKTRARATPSVKAQGEAEPPPGLDPAAWSRWCDYRVQIRKPIKPVSIPAAQRELAGFGAGQAAVVEQSIANSYQGLFALKNRPKRPEPEPRRELPDAFDVARRTHGS